MPPLKSLGWRDEERERKQTWLNNILALPPLLRHRGSLSPPLPPTAPLDAVKLLSGTLLPTMLAACLLGGTLGARGGGVCIVQHTHREKNYCSQAHHDISKGEREEDEEIRCHSGTYVHGFQVLRIFFSNEKKKLFAATEFAKERVNSLMKLSRYL